MRTKTPVPPPERKSVPKVTSEVETKIDSSAVWYLFQEEQISLYLKNLDNGEARIMIIQKGMTRLPLDAGHWELTGFEKDDASYASMNTSKKFVFRVKPKTHVYAGSLIIGCPKLAATELKYLKAMRFFDRYPFSSSANLCEMVIGNDFAFVRNTFKKAHKNKGLKLIMGF